MPTARDQETATSPVPDVWWEAMRSLEAYKLPCMIAEKSFSPLLPESKVKCDLKESVLSQALNIR